MFNLELVETQGKDVSFVTFIIFTYVIRININFKTISCKQDKHRTFYIKINDDLEATNIPFFLAFVYYHQNKKGLKTNTLTYEVKKKNE